MAKPNADTTVVIEATSPTVYEVDDNGDVIQNGDFAKLDEIAEPNTVDVAAPAAPAAAAAPATTEYVVPAQYRDKTQAEMAKMLEDSQRMVGRHAKEVGELRQLADNYIKARLAEQTTQARTAAAAAPAAPKPAVEDDTDADVRILANPRKAIAEAIESGVANHPEVKKLREQNQRREEEQVRSGLLANQAKFAEAHPDAPEIMASPEFQDWINASKVRVKLLEVAHKRYDIDAAMEIFGLWKERTGRAAAAPAAAVAAPAAPAKSKRVATATVPTSGGGGGSPASPGGGKIYRRADIIDLMENKPDRYLELAPEIERAYREGRVR